jgi:hypothetical protein
MGNIYFLLIIIIHLWQRHHLKIKCQQYLMYMGLQLCPLLMESLKIIGQRLVRKAKLLKVLEHLKAQIKQYLSILMSNRQVITGIMIIQWVLLGLMFMLVSLDYIKLLIHKISNKIEFYKNMDLK